MKRILTTTLLLSATTAICSESKPNIIVFLVDDMGVMDTSLPFLTDTEGNLVESPLNKIYRTPNMERLAECGVRFSTFYAQSVSSPTRVSIMTGQNSTRHGVTIWINSHENNRGTYGPMDWNWEGIKKSDQTLPRVMKSAGYKTIHVGKAHFAALGYDGTDPLNLGFDINIAGSEIGSPGSYYGHDGYGNINQKHNIPKKNAVKGLEKYWGTQTFLTEALTLEAKAQIDSAVEEKRPFFLYMAQHAVHSPHQIDDRFKDNYEGLDLNPRQLGFATLIEGMDRSLGDILDHLEEEGIAENTLILFVGDNGSDAPMDTIKGYGSSTPLRGKKGTEYEGGVRVPFIAAWAKPDKSNKFQQRLPIIPNTIERSMGRVYDIFPTVASIGGAAGSSSVEIDGYDLSTLLQGKSDEKSPNTVLMHFPHEHRGRYFTTYRNGDYKIIYHYNPQIPSMPMCEMYNLALDPYETEDIAFVESKKLCEMIELMTLQLEAEDAMYPQDQNGNEIKPIVPAIH